MRYQECPVFLEDELRGGCQHETEYCTCALTGLDCGYDYYDEEDDEWMYDDNTYFEEDEDEL